MSSIVIDFEVLPEDGAGDQSASNVCNELSRQLHDPGSTLRSGEFRHYAASASISAPGSGTLASAEEMRDFPPPNRPGDGGDRSNFGGGFGAGGSDWNQPQQQHHHHHADIPVGNMSHGELMDEIRQRERQLQHTAAGGHGEASRGRHPMEAEALEEKCGHLQHRLDEAERQLREAQESARIDRSRAQRFETNLKDREQLLVHAKEMWMKESGRASKLADALTSAEDRLADQEKRLQEVSDRYNEAQSEVRQLRHLLDGPDGGGFGGGFSGNMADLRTNGYSNPKGPSTSPSHNFSPPNSSNVVFQPSSAFDSKYDQQPSGPMQAAQQIPRGMGQPDSPTGTGHLPQVPSLPPLEAETNADRFRHLCLTNDAVLYEDDMLQVGLKTEYRGLEGQVAVYYGNKGSAALQAFQVHYSGGSVEEGSLRLTSSAVPQQLNASEQEVQRISVACVQPFVDPPLMRIQYLLPDACPRRIQLKFPVVITKFMQGLDMKQDEFFHLWRSQRFVLNEVTSVVNLATRLRTALVHVQRSLIFGGALRLLYGFDPNPDNFVLVSQLADQGGSRESGLTLIRVEVGSARFNGKARIVVRASDHAISRAVCESIVLQLTQPASSSFEPAR